jgi:outer membrane protein TolC
MSSILYAAQSIIIKDLCKISFFRQVTTILLQSTNVSKSCATPLQARAASIAHVTLVAVCLNAGIQAACIAQNAPTPSLQPQAAEAPTSSPPFGVKPLPPEPSADHEANKHLDMGPFRLSSFIRLSTLQPIKLEASYDEPLTLRDALTYAIRNSLPIKISKESWNYQKLQLFGEAADIVPIPNFGMSYNLTGTNIQNTGTNSSSNVFQTTLRFPVFAGGANIYTFLAQYYRDKGWRQAYYASVNDAVLDVYQKYENLVLQNALLQINAKGVEVSQAQLQLNNTLYQAGTGTQFAIMQSRTQLATARQALLQQQALVRQSALALAFSLNLPMAINVVPQEETISEQSLIDEHLSINEMLNVALVHRPELRQYELFRLAAARNVQVAAAPLYPTVSFFTSYTKADTAVHPPGGNVGGAAVSAITSSQNGSGTASNNALGQTASFSPTGSTTAGSGASNTISTPIVAGSGGNPLNLVQSGSIVTSGAVAPSIAGGNGGGTGGTGSSNINGSNTAGAGVFGGQFNTVQTGFSMNWALTNMGITNALNILSARALSRQALLQANQELLLVTEQVRADFLSAITSRAQIDNAAYGAVSARESLRMATMRLRAGMGTNLELMQAQQGYITSLTSQAQAIVSSNLAQAQLLHDMGVISVDSLLKGYQPAPADLMPKRSKSKP